MMRFIVRRLLMMVLVMFLISVLTFTLFEAIPNGNPAFRLAGRTATTAEIHYIEVKYGFNKPLWDQYLRTMKNIFTGQAYSYTNAFNVVTEIRHDLPTTLSLALGAGILWLFTSIVFGTIAALKAGRYADRVLTVVSMIGVSMPPFFLGALFIYFLGYKAGIFPLGGYVPLTTNPGQWLKHMILPWVTLSVLFVGFYSRVLRSTILDTINEDYIRTAKAKGLSSRQVMLRHILRNSMIPIFSLWALDVAQVIGGGAILTETVYNMHGVGQLAATAIGNLDIITIMVITLLIAFAVVFVQAIMDIVYSVLDPRIRLGV
ncbi:MAG: ABC transporter permease [Solirubrobacteraceae bacterium]